MRTQKIIVLEKITGHIKLADLIVLTPMETFKVRVSSELSSEIA